INTTTGKAVGTPLKLSNTQQGRANTTFIRDNADGTSTFLVATGNGNNNEARVQLLNADANGKITIKSDSLLTNEGNIARPDCKVTGANHATCCWADGNNRPPPNGAACGIVNTQTGQASTKKIVVKAQRGGNGTPAKYQNQVSLAKLDANVCGLG